MRLLDVSAFESAVLRWIAARSDDNALERQLTNVQVVEREYTVVGCYSKLLVAPIAPASSASYAGRGPLRGPNFASEAVEHGGGTLLWFKLGRADRLEDPVHGGNHRVQHPDEG